MINGLVDENKIQKEQFNHSQSISFIVPNVSQFNFVLKILLQTKNSGYLKFFNLVLIWLVV